MIVRRTRPGPLRERHGPATAGMMGLANVVRTRLLAREGEEGAERWTLVDHSLTSGRLFVGDLRNRRWGSDSATSNSVGKNAKMAPQGHATIAKWMNRRNHPRRRRGIWSKQAASSPYIPRDQACRVGGAVPWATGRWVQALRGGCSAGGWQTHELPKHPNSAPLQRPCPSFAHAEEGEERLGRVKKADLSVLTLLKTPAD